MSSIAGFALQFNRTAEHVQDTVLCNTTFDAANATGSQFATPNFNANARFGIAIGLAQNNNASSIAYGGQASLLIDPGNIPYLTNSTLGFDVCAFAFNVRAIQESALFNAQQDDGSCSSLFSSDCVSAIKQSAMVASASVYNSAQGSGNVTTFCEGLRQNMNTRILGACSAALKNDSSLELIAAAAPITQQAYNVESVLSKSCTVKNGSETWYNVNTLGNGKIDLTTYDLITYVVWPVIGLFSPPLNRRVTPTITETEITFRCLHIDHFNPGSRVPQRLGFSTPANSTTSSNTTSSTSATSPAANTASASSSSNGPPPQAIAGIVIGHIVLLAVIIGCIWWCCWRKKKRGARSARGAVRLRADDEVIADAPNQKHQWHVLNEMSPDTYKSELPGPPAAVEMHQHHQFELEAEGTHKELAGDRPVYEMPAYYPDRK